MQFEAMVRPWAPGVRGWASSLGAVLPPGVAPRPCGDLVIADTALRARGRIAKALGRSEDVFERLVHSRGACRREAMRHARRLSHLVGGGALYKLHKM